MKLATTTGDFSRYTNNQQKICEYIKNAGFKNIDYNFGMDYRCKSGIFGAEPEKHIEELKKYADKNELKFIQAHSPMGTPIVKDQNYDGFIADTQKCIEACAKLGIENIVVHSGYEKGLSKEECFIRNKEFYAPLLNTAEKCGVNILTENFNIMFDPELFWVDNATDMLNLIQCVDHPLFHCCWDAGHGNLQKMPQHEELKILGSHVYALHVQDNLGNGDYHTAPFFGSLNIDSLMHGLKEIDYKGYFTFEADCLLSSAARRRPFEQDTRLFEVPFEIQEKAEALLYDIGKCILTKYDCFEE